MCARFLKEQNGRRPQQVRDSPKMKYDSIMMLISIEQDIKEYLTHNISVELMGAEFTVDSVKL